MKINVEQFAGKCSCGKCHNIFVKDIFIEWDAIKKLPLLLAQKPYCDYGKPLLICDDNTWKAAGKEICEDLLHIGSICLDSNNLHANEFAVQKVLDNMPSDIGILI
ncbi:MAG: sn-glycerol-1-phosphate dehydrogenase, partial [Christensenellaceae bacterium]